MLVFLWPGCACQIIEKVVGFKRIAPDEIKALAVNIVTPSLSDYVNLTDSPANLGARCSGSNTDFLS